MIIKTTLGADFAGALAYGAGLRKGGAVKAAELLVSRNLIHRDPAAMAAEMTAAAGQSGRIAKPVWHTSLSWPPGERLSREQKLAAAERYCALLVAQQYQPKSIVGGEPEPVVPRVWDEHQVAIYEHHDTGHEHIHIYINRVPLYGGPALRTDKSRWNDLAALRIISQEMGLTPLPSMTQPDVKLIIPERDAAKKAIRSAIAQLLAGEEWGGARWFQGQLQQQGISVNIKKSQAGAIVGVSFEVDSIHLKGQDVGWKATQLSEALRKKEQLHLASAQVVTTQLALLAKAALVAVVEQDAHIVSQQSVNEQQKQVGSNGPNERVPKPVAKPGLLKKSRLMRKR